ncbi:hypothetical protein CTA2_8068 [Colletotrichum tanaceti]|uniref:Uncharacterized protein n=1 Tax=Colletotrichum tanaceti TaxID=1306861 RepID=A0A4U6X8C2_9PEZI|nr:hypothetical protein CTA2_8068 [Colletotrichum tanaceti]TKW51752.1 hypothetical protein CTA1_1060 [Colletotrichum tanaceti]
MVTRSIRLGFWSPRRTGRWDRIHFLCSSRPTPPWSISPYLLNMRFFSLALVSSLLAATAIAGPVELESRQQYSPCVRRCLDEHGIFDGIAVQGCRQECGEWP